MEEFDILAVNSAIKSLIENHEDTEAAAIIIQYARDLPKCWPFAFQCHIKTDRVYRIRSQDPGQPDVRFADKGEWREISWGMPSKRAGYYKLWKPEKDFICFQESWLYDPTTRDKSIEHPIYAILYHRKKLACLDFFKRVDTPRYRIGRMILHQEAWQSVRTGRRKSISWHLSIEKSPAAL